MGGHTRSGVALAISWNDSKKEKKGKVLALSVATALSLTVLSPAMRSSMSEGMQEMVSVIVRAFPGEARDAAEAVERSGGSIGLRLRILQGFAAEVPAENLSRLSTDPSILAVTPDKRVEMLQLTDPVDTIIDPITEPSPTPTTEPSPTPEPVPTYDPTTDNGSMYST